MEHEYNHHFFRSQLSHCYFNQLPSFHHRHRHKKNKEKKEMRHFAYLSMVKRAFMLAAFV